MAKVLRRAPLHKGARAEFWPRNTPGVVVTGTVIAIEPESGPTEVVTVRWDDGSGDGQINTKVWSWNVDGMDA